MHIFLMVVTNKKWSPWDTTKTRYFCLYDEHDLGTEENVGAQFGGRFNGIESMINDTKEMYQHDRNLTSSYVLCPYV